MKYQISYHPGFNRDMKRIRHWIQEFADDVVARRRLRKIRTAARGLADFPMRGTTHDELVPGLRLLPVGAHAVVTFVVDEDSRHVHVLAVSFAGSDWIKASQERA